MKGISTEDFLENCVGILSNNSPRCLEKREISTVLEFDVVARFRETIPTVKFVPSSKI